MTTLGENLKSLPQESPLAQLLSGCTPSFASTMDQRFSFGLYVPKGHRFNGPELDLLVVVHGMPRGTAGYLNRLKSFSDDHNCIIMTPLFPAGIEDPEDLHNYKTLLYRDIRFDLILLSMIDQASKIWRIKTAKFYLHGFSGGGQFAHRFLFIYPDRLAGVSIGAPGRITSPIHKEPWPAGLLDVPDVFEVPGAPDWTVIKKVPVQFVVGAKDTDTDFLDIANPTTAGQEAGKTRVDKIKWLKKAFDSQGVQSELAVVPDVGHDDLNCLEPVEKWFASLLPAKTASTKST